MIQRKRDMEKGRTISVIGMIFILLIWIALDMLRLHWSDLGFSKKGLSFGLKYGLVLGISTFFLSYAAEFIVLSVMGKHPSLRFYITNFSLTQTHTNGSSLLAVIVCIIGNIVNVCAEEGLFRGLFCKIGIQYYSQKTANIIQSLLFGIWHITNVINPLLDGSMKIAMAVFMGVGYILLSGILACEWGMCAVKAAINHAGTLLAIDKRGCGYYD